MVDFAEAELIDPNNNRLFIYVDPKDEPLLKLLSSRGFEPGTASKGIESEFDLVNTALPDETHLPEGFQLQSMRMKMTWLNAVKPLDVGLTIPTLWNNHH